MRALYLGGGFQLDAGVQQLQDHFDVSLFGGQVQPVQTVLEGGSRSSQSAIIPPITWIILITSTVSEKWHLKTESDFRSRSKTCSCTLNWSISTFLYWFSECDKSTLIGFEPPPACWDQYDHQGAPSSTPSSGSCLSMLSATAEPHRSHDQSSY